MAVLTLPREVRGLGQGNATVRVLSVYTRAESSLAEEALLYTDTRYTFSSSAHPGMENTMSFFSIDCLYTFGTLHSWPTVQRT